MIVDISEIIENKKNPRFIKDDKFKKIVKSVKEFPEMLSARPIVVDENMVILGGNMRFKALMHAGAKEVEIKKVEGWTEQQKKEFIIKDNVGFGEWDWDTIANEWEDLDLEAWGLDVPLWESEDLNPAKEEESVGLDPQGDPSATRGDVYQLGEHRLMCGDSTIVADVDKLMNGESGSLMVTDPPYGVNYDPEWRPKALGGAPVKNAGKVLNDERPSWGEAYDLFPGDVAYVWHSAQFTHIFAKDLIDSGFVLVSQIIWNKNSFALSRGDYHWKHEPCWYAVREGSGHRWQGKRDQATVWNIDAINCQKKENKEEKTGHGTQKPLECMMRPILNNSKKGDRIYDPFGGSGTTLVACEQTKRKCYMMELSEKYCDTIIKRWEKLTGEEAVLLADKLR